MKIDKEYPATHSMETAWYCVDEDGNVGIFDIEENGPVPVDRKQEHCAYDISELIEYVLPFNNTDGTKELPLTEEQIKMMLSPINKEDKGWKKEFGCWYNNWWSELIVKVDMNKYDFFLKALSLDNDSLAICMSRKNGWFLLNLSYNKLGVDLLENQNVFLEKYSAPYYHSWSFLERDKGKEDVDIIKNMPVFWFYQDGSPGFSPSIRIANPPIPMKIEQLLLKDKESITRLPILFKDTKYIQLADHLPVAFSNSCCKVYINRIWDRLASSDGGFFYYNQRTRMKISNEEMEHLLVSGEAEEYDYHNERHYQLMRGGE